MPSDRAAAWVSLNCGSPLGLFGFRSTPTRESFGKTSLSSSSRFAAKPTSMLDTPVV